MNNIDNNKATAKTKIHETLLPPDYKPSSDEEFMNPMQIEFFRQKLLKWRQELIDESADTISNLRKEELSTSDLIDRASLESEQAVELRTRDRYRKLITKIEDSLHRIETGEYGYCSIAGEEIPIERLIARPTANMTTPAQEEYEKSEMLNKKTAE